MLVIMTKKDILAIFGGPAALARHLGVTPGAVTQWKRIPPRHYQAIIAFAKKKRIKLTYDALYAVQG